MESLVSIVVPVYNGAESISQTIKSVLEQTYKNLELVVIDDGSTDNTASVIQSFEDNRIVLKQITNGGVSNARNVGIEIAKGAYISFLDSDDSYELDYIENMLNHIQYTNSDLCFCGYNVVSVDSRQPRDTSFKTNNVLEDYLLGKIAVQTAGWLVKKSVLDDNTIRFVENISWGEDIEFFSEVISMSKSIVSVEQYLVNYLIDGDDQQLSAFSLDKIDRDYESIMRMVASKHVNSNSRIERILLGYRLPALLVYRMKTALERGYSIQDVQSYYQKYSKEAGVNAWNNGLRSIKLYLTQRTLRKQLKDKFS
ncbi:glycosyltransferase [Erysipelothrix sp. HDW6C]|uniref:glycosyltransferase family 2 protein n=1 Tax=Erysipelothrix sp. HDW6C TaxID=2714930 RepID=UPI00140C3A20|nr:glycosyltransferase family 2 protein [Erysipelothrix sp. HDW6C]QIK69392.1 glycosyltransferase [Erysipelothrix sp. HDW6C]